jgi:hypothetical protein
LVRPLHAIFFHYSMSNISLVETKQIVYYSLSI